MSAGKHAAVTRGPHSCVPNESCEFEMLSLPYRFTSLNEAAILVGQ